MACAATPCTGVDRSLTAKQKLVFAQNAAKQLGMENVSVLQTFHFGVWRIVYVSTEASDSAFLFYHGDPAAHKYVALWAGAATASDEVSIDAWMLKNAPGIPPALAKCFAWDVTNDLKK